MGKTWPRALFLLFAVVCLGAPASVQTTRLAVIGDYGTDTPSEEDVANLVKSWNPDFVLTVGDNNYPTGSAETIDQNIGKYYHEYIYNYVGAYGRGSATRRFLPTLGNHDWGLTVFHDPRGADPYLAYFDLPGNERYYDFLAGLVHVFAIDSDFNEPDGVTSDSPQAAWLEKALAASDAPWKIVLFHQPAYSSAQLGSSVYMRWPFQAWGASAVLSGHGHAYERLLVRGLPFFVDGLGGDMIDPFSVPLPESQVRYNEDWGAMLLTATATALTFEFQNRAGLLVDSYTLSRTGPAPIPSQPRRQPLTVPWHGP